jgi:hypothetical protein
VARTPSDGDFDAFHRRQDGREEYMRAVVWAAMISLRRRSATPTEEEFTQAAELAWATYHRNVVSRLPSADLDAEGRGRSAFLEKWAAAWRKFNSDIAVEAEKEPLAQSIAEPTILPDTEGNLTITAAEFVAGFKPPIYVIDGIVQRGSLYTATGRTGAGKTAVMMLLASYTARGKALKGRYVEQGAVLYLAGENPDDLRARLMVLADREGFDPAELPMFFISGVVDIKASMPRIRAEMQVRGVELLLVIVDTAAAYFLGDDDNSNAQKGAYARDVLRPLTTLPGKPAVIVPAHPVKNAAKDNLLPAGGGAFANEVDGNLTLWADTQEQSTLHWHGKIRGPEFEPITFKLETARSDKVVNANGDLMPSVVASPISEFEAEANAKEQHTDENLILGILLVNPPISLANIARKANWTTGTGEPARTKVNRLCHGLRDDGLITLKRKHWRLTNAGRKLVSGETDE